jgi:GrpB-like predicted nucleotidyltransferase (UPF0157 family)
MKKNENIFTICEISQNEIQKSYNDVIIKIQPYLPNAEIIHIGSTAIPGCLTKGDIDIVIRVSETDFLNSMCILNKILVRSNRNLPTEDYAEFDFLDSVLPVSIQLVSKNGAYDDFHLIKNIICSDKRILQNYNDLKLTFNGCDMEDYRLAKKVFFNKLLQNIIP